jgi:hypothetical protein
VGSACVVGYSYRLIKNSAALYSSGFCGVGRVLWIISNNYTVRPMETWRAFRAEQMSVYNSRHITFKLESLYIIQVSFRFTEFKA